MNSSETKSTRSLNDLSSMKCGLCAYRPSPIVQKGSPFDYKTLQSRAVTTCKLANAILFSGFMTSPCNNSDIRSCNNANTYGLPNNKNMNVKSLRTKLRKCAAAFKVSQRVPRPAENQSRVSVTSDSNMKKKEKQDKKAYASHDYY